MKNIANYLYDFIEDGDVYEHIKKFNKFKRTEETNRKVSCEEEINEHTHPINHNHVWKSKKYYTRKKNKNNYN